MNRIAILFLITACFSIGCRDDFPDNSKLVLQNTESFIVTSVQKDASGFINAIGYDVRTNQNLIYRYDGELHFIEKINLSNEHKFAGALQVKFLPDNTCLISQYTTDPNPQLIIHRTDADFNITQKNILRSSTDSLFSATMREMILLKNGDIGICYDTIAIPQRELIFGGYVIARLDKDLNLIHNYQESFGRYYGHHSPKIVEQKDGSIFFLTSTIVQEQNFPYGRISIGTLTALGEIENYKVLELEKEQQWLEPYSLSSTDNEVVFHFMANVQNLRYLHINTESGLITKDVELPYGEINHRNERGNWFNKFPLGSESFISGSANELPKSLMPNQGNFLFSTADQSLYFQKYNEDGSFSRSFTLNLPELDNLYSYRHVFTDEKTIILAISYDHNGRNYLNLQEMSLDGELIP